MRVFVASWFFPPSTSSEGIVAYKLLKNSTHEYEVCSAVSDQWGYNETIAMTADNIKQFLVETDSINEWVEEAIFIFEREHERKPYDAIMTRSMPPESIDVAKAIKEKHPDLPWIASLGDPISRVPWMTKSYITNNKNLTKSEKESLRNALNAPRPCAEWVSSKDKNVRTLARYKNWEMEALRNAELVITPSASQLSFMLCGMRRNNAIAIGHSYDPSLYPGQDSADPQNNLTEIVFLGYASDDRTLVPFVEALHTLQRTNPDALAKLRIRFIGNIVDDSISLIYNYYLNDIVSIEGNVSYEESLGIMENADWLLHVDTYYNEFAFSGGSVYFAGKLADYLGSGKPIIALTGKNSPADKIVAQAGGLSFQHKDIQSLASALERIANGTETVSINHSYRQEFLASNQAQKLDHAIAAMFDSMSHPFNRTTWPDCKPSEKHKVLSICVPSYNVQAYLDRCLLSIINSGVAEKIEVLVVNDGSMDNTREIALAYEEHYPDIVKLVDKANGGHGSTINTAIPLASGDYFRVLDGDDWLNPRDLYKFIHALETLSEPVDIISSDYVQIDINSGKLNPIKKKSPEIEYGKVYEISSIPLTKEYLSIHSITYRTELLKKSGLRLQEKIFYVDVEYQMMVLPWVRTIMFLPGKLYHYAVGNSEQSISRTSFVNRYDHHDKVVKRTIQFYYDHQDEMSQNVRAYFDYLILNHFLDTHYTISLLFDDDRERGLARAQEFDGYLKKNYHDLYQQVGEKYPAVAEARKHNFNTKLCQKTSSLRKKKPTKMQAMARSGVRKVMRGGIGTVVAEEVNKRKGRH